MLPDVPRNEIDVANKDVQCPRLHLLLALYLGMEHDTLVVDNGKESIYRRITVRIELLAFH